MGVLTVYLDKCVNLADKDVMSRSDPYVTITCKKDSWGKDKDVGQQKSSIKKNELNPVYGETFHFTIPETKDVYLYVSVKDDEIGKDDSLGSCKIELKDIKGLGETPVEVKKVIDRNLLDKNGEIFLKVSYKE